MGSASRVPTGPDSDEPPLIGQATLSVSKLDVAAARTEVVGFVQHVGDVLRGCADAAVAAEPAFGAEIVDSDATAARLLALFQQRFGKVVQSRGLAAFTGSLTSWKADAGALVTELETFKAPFRVSKMLALEWSFGHRVDTLVRGLPAVQQALAVESYSRWRQVAQSAAAQHFVDRVPVLKDHLDTVTTPDPVVGYLGPGAMESGPVPGVGPLRFVAGFATLSKLRLSLRAPGVAVDTDRPDSLDVETGPFAIPTFVDLDTDGGLATNDRDTVNNVLLRMLALLPAGMARFTLFDPIRLGSSADVLFGLGECAPEIIGDKVRSTERELADLLLQLEEHITLVTQKFLHGRYERLTDYNDAAGDVAEPYRVLVLYDFPAGFRRPGGDMDEEALARLSKIVGAGPRCGVYTLIVTDEQGSGPAQHVVSQVPGLWSGRPMEPADVDRMCATPGAGIGSLGFGLGHQRGVPQRRLAATRTRPMFVVDGGAGWFFHAESAASPDTVEEILAHVQRGLTQAADVQVSAGSVTTLARTKMERLVRLGTRAPGVVAHPGAESTWWQLSSAEALAADFGRVGADDVATLIFDSKTLSSALVGGQTGSGKSVLLHAIIASLSMAYSPDELELYLVDFKEGVEFKTYASNRLPHARVVAIESEREFGLSVLQSLDFEISRRGELFRAGLGEEANLADYRRRTGETLPRIVLIIDEFHLLFEKDDKLASEAAELVDRVVRQGRAFGVHAILASQTIAGTAALGKHTINQIPTRIALQCVDVDSRLLLGEENPDAQLLSRPGEGIINTSKGLRDANRRFQAAFWSSEERNDLVATLAAKASASGVSRAPVVFEGRRPASVEGLSPRVLLPEGPTGQLQLPLGMPLTLGGPAFAALRREPGGNLLLLTDDESQAYPVLTLALATAAARRFSVRVLDFGATDAPWVDVLDALRDREQFGEPREDSDQKSPSVKIARSRGLLLELERLARLVTERHELQDFRSPGVLVIVPALHRARVLEADDLGPEAEALELILRDGPDIGVHVLAWCDRVVSLGRRLSSSTQKEFGIRVLARTSKEDSYRVIDSELAAQLDANQMVFDDHERARTARVRCFEQPSPGWTLRLAAGGH